jgi:probable LLM family oxidoreductase
MNAFELGVETFGDVTLRSDGHPKSDAEVIRDVVEEAVLADQVGLDFIGIGEHHRPDFVISAPEVVLAAIAGRTSRIHLGSAVTVLSSDDPVRVFQRFATLDAISDGRAEVILGRGSFTESFPLFGYDLSQYDTLFEEKLELFAALLKEGPINWSGTVRSPLNGQIVYPRTESGLRTWIGVGGSPESVVRAAHYNLPLMLAIIGGNPLRFAPLVALYRRALSEFDGTATNPIGLHSHGHVAATDQEALDQLWPHYAERHAHMARERGWPPMTREQFEASAGPDGALFVGSPETVAGKIVNVARGLGVSRFDMKYSAGTLPHELVMESIHLLGSTVAPLVRTELEGTWADEAVA